MINVRNLPYLRSLSSKDFPDLGSKLFEALSDLQNGTTSVEQQTNANGSGSPAPPPAISNLDVKGQNGHFNIAITDNNPIFRGIRYWVEHADNPHFTGAHVIDMGGSRNHNVFLGNVTRYWRAYSSYDSSAPSAPVYHGSGSTPRPVLGGGAIGGPAFTTPQSSGTGMPGQALQGPGGVPFRSVNGAPPVR